VVVKNLVNQCKCHGLSGSCQLKTCWKSSPNFRTVGKILKQQFRHAILVDQSNLGNGISIVPTKEAKRRRQSKSATNRNRRPSFTDFKNNEAKIWQQQQQHQQKQKKQQKQQQQQSMKSVVVSTATSSKNSKKSTKKNGINNSLFYFQKSPNFCEKDSISDIAGTHGRRCNQWSFGSDSCTSLCCGRGYYLVKEVTKQRCHCRFHWCCDVECQTCEQIEWISICN
jgi:wingless-type MMTV integration site family, member 10